MIRLVKDECCVSLQVGGKVGLNLTFFWANYVGDKRCNLRLIAWGTFLGRNPYNDPRCFSNGTVVFSIGK